MRRAIRAPTPGELVSLASAVLSAVAIFLLVGLRLREPPWVLDRRALVVGLGFSLAFVVALPVVRSRLWRTQARLSSVVRTVALGSLACLPVTAALLVRQIAVDPRTLATELGAFFGLLLLNSLPIRPLGILLLSGGVFAVAVAPSVSGTAWRSLMDVAGGNAANARQSVEFVFSSLHDVKVTDYPVFDTAKTEHGGGLGVIDRNRLLLLTGDGEFYLMSLVEGGIEFNAQNVRSPFDKSRYRAAVEQPSPYFRVMDLLVADGTGNPRSVFVSYHHWDEPQQCVTLKVAEASIDFDRLGATELQWHVRFTSTPCVPHDRMNNGTGGRMALLPPSTLLVTVGETVHEMTDLARDDSVSYGKIMAVDRRDWSARVFSKGHRNPQGLLVDGDTIWSTEHGPHGGDELNVIVEGEDYGWPDATYGTEYGQKTWPRSPTPGDHSVGRRPVYAWVPSIGVSEVIQIRGPGFPSWRGDLLVSSLSGLGNGYSLYRVRIRDGSIHVVERIRTALLVRDLVEGPDGRIVMWDGLRTIQIVESANHIFTPCAGCHALRRLNHGIGPDLWSIVGRAVASHRDFQYSAALRDFGGRWSRDRLDAFLRAPAEAVPGTSMDIPGIEDADERRAIIEYLEKLPD